MEDLSIFGVVNIRLLIPRILYSSSCQDPGVACGAARAHMGLGPEAYIVE